MLEVPVDEVPVSVAFDAELLRGDGVALFVSGLQVHADGVRLRLELRARDPQDGTGMHDALLGPGADGPEVRVEYADGRSGQHTGVGSSRRGGEGGVVLFCHGGGGGDRACSADFWLSPRPPVEGARLVCSWPARGLAESVVALPVGELADAARRVVRLW